MKRSNYSQIENNAEKSSRKSSFVTPGNDPFPHNTLKHRRTVLERAEKFLSPLYFKNVNLFGRLYKHRIPVKSIKHYGPTDDAYKEAVKHKKEFKSLNIGESFGTTFTRHWFELVIEIPASWIGCHVQLIWEAGSEGMLWRDGEPVFSFTAEDERGIKKAYTITDKLAKTDNRNIKLMISVSCNRLLGEGKDGMINPPDMDKKFSLSQADVVAVDEDAYETFLDLQVIYDITKALPEESQRSHEALLSANRMINELVRGDFTEQAYADVYKIASGFFGTKNREGQHVVHAMGHCHIDSAWLWPYRETIHKCARSWISTISLMEKYPQFTFTCSQAQQFFWVKENYPKIYQKLKKCVKRGNFKPVGGTWVEMDGNLPSGEAMVRQFYYGQKYFRDEFGITCNEFWLPDTFGYSANLPQIMKEAGICNFLTQKLSWNLVNTFPHNTFFWEGIDGTKMLSHFPPGNSYGMMATADELVRTLDNHKDKGRSDASVFLFGHGDGGGGPTEDMLRRLSRMSDCAGLPKVEMSTPDNFFSQVRKHSDRLCTWVGELFLELHNGTYTTQAKIKKYNRKCEVLLHNVEFTSALAWLLQDAKKQKDGFTYPSQELEKLWKLLLLNQFHDVLPGSSIEEVNKDAWEYYEDVTKSAESLLQIASHDFVQKTSSSNSVVINTLAWERKEVVELADKSLAYIQSPSLGFTSAHILDIPPVVVTENSNGTISMRNEVLTCTFDQGGRLVSLSLVDSECGRELVKDGCYGNQMVMFDDVPLFWDAWDVMDYHLETRTPVLDVMEVLHVSDHSSPLRGTLEFSIRISERSKLKQTIQLDAGSPQIMFKTTVDWHEDHKFLKVEFPWNIKSTKATYEIQFGHLERPTHQNTSWDSARFEVWGHKWADLSQYDQGVALLNDCKYGYSAFGDVMRLSLLRSPKAPDGNADMGEHEFTYALMPHKGSFQESGVIKQAHQLNNPLHVVQGELSRSDDFSFARVSSDAIILDTCKKSDMHEGAILIRLYESFGSSVNTEITFPNFKISKINRCNILEDINSDEQVDIVGTNSFTTDFTPFHIKSFLVWFP